MARKTLLVEVHGNDGSSHKAAAATFIKKEFPGATIHATRLSGERCSHGNIKIEVEFTTDLPHPEETHMARINITTDGGHLVEQFNSADFDQTPTLLATEISEAIERANGLKEATHVPLIPAAQTTTLRHGDALRFDIAEPGKIVCFTADGERVYGLIAGRVGAAFSGGDVILSSGKATWVVGPDEWPAMDVQIA